VRGNVKLRLQYRAVLAYLGVILAMVGAVMLFPLAVLVAWPEEAPFAAAFAVPGLGAIAVGVFLFWLCRGRQAVLGLQEGGVLVLAGWTAACLVGAWPLVVAGHLTVTQAVFESVSGWTTTGLSVVDVTQASKMVLLWRSTMQLVGGAGLAIIMLATLIGPVGPGLSDAEGRSDQLVPHVRRSAKLVFLIYQGYAVLTVLGYLAAGLGWFDAVNHAFAAVSTGGFSTYPDSIGHWDSPAVELVTIVGMLLGQLSFLTAYLVLSGAWRAAVRDGEVRYVAVLLPVSTLALFLVTCLGAYPTLAKSFRVALFETATALTTTGFSTVSYNGWNGFGVLVLILLMIVGGGTCSTAGGVKQYRVVLLAKAAWWEVRRLLLPRTAVVQNSVWHGNQRFYVDDVYVRRVGVFFFLYVLTLALGTAVLAAHGYGLRDALFEFASAQGTVGLSLGLTAPDAPGAVLWAEILGMFLGRLEFFVVFASLAKLVRDVPVLVRST
jgi:trk system potassium uptake protein TrkH